MESLGHNELNVFGEKIYLKKKNVTGLLQSADHLFFLHFSSDIISMG